MDKNQALRQAMALCSRQEHSEADIRRKLEFWGTPPKDIDSVIGQLIKEKFIDDLRFTIAYASDKIRLNHWGKIKIRYMLSMDQIKHSVIDQALEEIDEDLYTETLKELLQKKARELTSESNPYTKKQKLIKFAQSRGFEVDLILRALKGMT